MSYNVLLTSTLKSLISNILLMSIRNSSFVSLLMNALVLLRLKIPLGFLLLTVVTLKSLIIVLMLSTYVSVVYVFEGISNVILFALESVSKIVFVILFKREKAID